MKPLPRPPAPSRFETDPIGYVRELNDFLHKLTLAIEGAANQAEAPAKAVFEVTGVPAPTTTLDGATADLTAVINYLGGQYETFQARGFIRTRAGAT